MTLSDVSVHLSVIFSTVKIICSQNLKCLLIIKASMTFPIKCYNTHFGKVHSSLFCSLQLLWFILAKLLQRNPTENSKNYLNEERKPNMPKAQELLWNTDHAGTTWIIAHSTNWWSPFRASLSACCLLFMQKLNVLSNISIDFSALHFLWNCHADVIICKDSFDI